MEQSPGSKASILGNSHIVYTKVIINGEEIEDSNFRVNIHQKVAEHDTFEVVCPTEALEGFGAYPMTNSRDFLGEKITIKLIQFGKDAYSFTGIITAIKNKKFDGYEGHIILSGYSPTILLENGLDCQSYEKQSLKEIITKATQGYPQDSVGFVLKPNHTTAIDYTVQYKESDFEFIKRLATRHGEWLYYNGDKIVFGRNNEETIDLEEESEMFEYEMKMQVVPQNFTYLSYESNQGATVSEDAKAAQKTNYNNPFLNHAVKISEKVYQKAPVSLYNHSLLENGTTDLREAVKLQKDKRANVFFVEGKSRKPDLKLGSFIKMKGIVNGEKSFSGTIPLETYRIVELTNHHDGLDDYYNTFVAVPFEILVPNYMNDDAVPVCEEQSATVVDNDDPKGMGRMRVQFAWQKQTNEKSPWLRMTTGYAGGDRGDYKVPEIGDEVQVAFEGNNAEKPYVTGAMYNGNAKSSYHTPGNDQKVIQTRSGTKIIMNDAIGSVFIEDPSGNTWFMDGKGSIDVNAPKDINMKAGGSINMTAGQNINTAATMNITESAGVDKSTSVGMLHNLSVGGDSNYNVTGTHNETIMGDKKTHTEKDMSINNKDGVTYNTEGEIGKHSKKSIGVNSAEKSKLF
jgi:type VI secretion system secreted protein VgrG